MSLIFDDQRCCLQTGFNNLFDAVTFISNGECYLFDERVFRVFQPTVWIFSSIAENSGPMM